ncbi:MAG TPA: molybdopterin-synthase adenylyltransferase MoeB [Candidatus Acidoferrum sp.]|nr:molybdopterin-synthase adenylyltransferase MoeB [Candidatus Acidoferrum sp.]
MNDEQLLRYSRQLMLPGIDVSGQEKLLAARVLIVGLGGLGCPAAMYLADAGVGQLTLVDHDRVDFSNLQRQIAHTTANVGQFKVDSAAATLQALNPGVAIETLPRKLEGDELQALVARHDAVLDCTDNFAIRFALNAACVAARVPLVSAAAIRLEAQVSVFDPRQSDSPCYRCLYEEDAEADLSCAHNGVLAPLVGVIGSLQALECLKLLTGLGRSLAGRLLLLDAATMEWRELKLRKQPDCPVCRH